MKDNLYAVALAIGRMVTLALIMVALALLLPGFFKLAVWSGDHIWKLNLP